MKELNNDFIIFFDRNQTSGKLIDRVKNTFYIYFMIMNKRLFSVINESVSASHKNWVIFVMTFMLSTSYSFLYRI